MTKCNIPILFTISDKTNLKAQSAGAVDNANYTSAKGSKTNNECFGYDTKPSDSEAPVLEL